MVGEPDHVVPAIEPDTGEVRRPRLDFEDDGRPRLAPADLAGGFGIGRQMDELAAHRTEAIGTNFADHLRRGAVVESRRRFGRLLVRRRGTE